MKRVHTSRGAASVWFALLLPVLIGSAGIAIDIGRMYVAKTELQSFVDAGALAATAELDGTADGLSRAGAAASAAWTKWRFGSRDAPTPTVEFSTGPEGPWLSAAQVPSPPAGYRFLRLVSTAAVPMYVVQVATRQEEAAVASGSAAAQVRVSHMSEGLFPFSPMAHSSDPDAADGYGLVKGQKYALRWSSNAASDVSHNRTSDFCPGDADPAFHAALQIAADAGNLSDRGYIEANSASVISASIQQGYQSFDRTVGDSLDFVEGMKASTVRDLVARAQSDTNVDAYGNSAAFNDPATGYYARPHNFRRVVIAPIARPPDSPSPNQILDFALFLLEPTYVSSPTKCWCAMYLGAGVAFTGRPGAQKTGLYVLKLVK